MERVLTIPSLACCFRRAGAMRATVLSDVYHAVLGVFLAEGRRPAALDVEGRVLCAGVVRATIAVDVYHAVFSMFPAECRRLSSLEVKGRRLRA